ncbi:MAG TPA: hypothetical protein VFC29_24045 [Candidatus Limnocylindrales bacterium]|jgi:hypothetical protein|nr:hypothetical protein [Candidatus Limnocylindrales bacterium]
MLQTKKYNRTSKGGRRGLHRERRLKLLSKFEPNWLTTDAPIGKYLVDGVAQELLKSGMTAAGADENIKFVERMRREISKAAEYSMLWARAHLVRGPERLRKAKRFFEDLRQIQFLINRNVDVTPWDLLYATKMTESMSEDEFLLDTLQDTGGLIEDCLEGRKPVGEGGNYDWLTHLFIQNIFDLWCRYISVEVFPDENRHFIRLIAAAWQDVGLPTEEDRRCLEDWLADRVRKQFHEGIHSARVSCEEFLAPQPPDPDVSAPPDPN